MSFCFIKRVTWSHLVEQTDYTQQMNSKSYTLSVCFTLGRYRREKYRIDTAKNCPNACQMPEG